MPHAKISALSFIIVLLYITPCFSEFPSIPEKGVGSPCKYDLIAKNNYNDAYVNKTDIKLNVTIIGKVGLFNYADFNNKTETERNSKPFMQHIYAIYLAKVNDIIQLNVKKDSEIHKDGLVLLLESRSLASYQCDAIKIGDTGYISGVFIEFKIPEITYDLNIDKNKYTYIINYKNFDLLLMQPIITSF